MDDDIILLNSKWIKNNHQQLKSGRRKTNDIAIILPPIKTTHGIYFQNIYNRSDFYYKIPFFFIYRG